VNSKGKILEEIRVPVVIDQGKAAVIQQLAELGKNFLARHPDILRVGLAAAGPLDPRKGLLLDPTNFKTSEGKGWGKVPLARLLGLKLQRPVFLENDAAGAMLAEHWIGAAKGYDNAIILTLGTGLGTGMIVNGKLERAGRYLHPEGGHIIINYDDHETICGCGNHGCSEAYLSGKNFELKARARLKNPTISAKEVAELARVGEKIPAQLFEEYALQMAVAIQNYVVLYAPEVVVFTGSFAATADLFLKKTQAHLERILARRRVGEDLMPKLAVSKLENHAGLVGGAYVAFHAIEEVRGAASTVGVKKRKPKASKRW
jgi:predicted NBD/HSP70 family sugar kinase